MLFRFSNFPSLILFKKPFSITKTKTIHFTKFTFSSSALAISNFSDTHFTKPSKISSFHPNTFQVLQKLYLYQNHPSLALSYFTQLNHHSSSHNIQTYSSIISIMCYWNCIRKLDSLFIDIIAHSKQDPSFKINDLFDSLFEDVVDVENKNQYLLRAFDGFVKACVSVSMFDEAIDFLLQTRKKNVVILPNVLSFNFLVNRLVVHDRVDTALFLFDEFKSFGLIFNCYTYAIMIKARCKKGDLENAFGVFDEMKEVGVNPDSYCYAALIEGLCNNQRTDLGYEMLRQCRTMNTVVDVYAYTAIIRGFCNEMKLDLAESVFLEMEKEGLVPDVYIYSAMIHGYCKSRNLDRALAIHDIMISKGIETNCVIISCILHCLDEMGEASEVVARFEKLKQSGVFLDGVAYNIVFDALCKLGKVDDAINMREDIVDLDIKHYTTLINGYCLQGKPVEALSLFKEMEEKDLKTDVVTYNVLVSGLFKNNRACEAIDLLEYMDSKSVEPNSITHKAIIEGLCSVGKIEEAEAYFNGLKDKSVEIYSAMVNGYCEVDLIEKSYELNKAVMLLDTMLKMNAKPSKQTHSKIFTALCCTENMKCARALFNSFVERGFTLDVVIYTIMIHSYCKMNCLQEAYELFQDMKIRGIKPDVIAYTVILEGLLNGGHAKIAVELYNEMCFNGMTPGATLKRCIQKAIRMQFHR
ncbi:pentatricopeptide repeat-containing protein At2g26790, mitochondrial-like [Vicia villosa]|uniref:pentatricopeptide repeat-containing protein At2g26790, mitochondrial-like n=1 Tax=Vicia villosa TaxID=3911 RepID=UPI00273C2C21|nr:pentatricopeptide repeat-containing protein At2g26790, mitochondrial-like [Vicia villosa]XP_058736375.1 pentatricopeptide repeat-containing protein At2g26790, mitochondrial-like [Vicia villosa]XP_058736376.1 pentatricopeptide repeat-containing protein At2g26790, mitochondrial-like [Vicia villosa]XP_058736377.1 pentatricopeptide repeat-containing protein At2g26790, mitochondrial-like [Vicia villosa]XP_058736378.1 pentatricopeptide repeat-containing protein At2g26790, mitochondrial-like [Vicia